ncbi:VCBS repeat-containing protein, partial [Acinetobacter seifertii]|uniref:Ig-like domain-containing protein n=1 Tax=Acinetobacter seifertii TaxID=1530123 RepID=UPI00190293C3
DGGVSWIDLTVTAGTWSYVDGRSLTDGNYTYDVRVVDAAGNVGSTDSQVVTVDSTAPSATTVIAIDSISDDTGLSASDFITSDSSLTVHGSLAGTLAAGEVAQISVDGGVSWIDLTVTAGTWSYVDGRSLTDGNYTYDVRVVDAAGNVGSTASQAVTIDTSVSSSVIGITAISTDTGTSSTDFITNDTTLTVSGTLTTALAADEKVQVSSDGGVTWVDATVTGTTWSLIDGVTHNSSFTYQARVTDTAGNVGSTASQAVTIDTTAPIATPSLTSISVDTVQASTTGTAGSSTINTATDSNFATRDNTLFFKGLINNTLSAGEALQISIDGTNWQSPTTFDGTNWTFDYSGTPFASNTYTLYMRTIDLAGNTNSSTGTYTVDTLAPALTLTQPVASAVTTSTSLTFTSAQSGTAEANSKVALVNDINHNGVYDEGIDVVLSTTTAAANGSWTLTSPTLAKNNIYNFAFMEWDAVGNRTRLTQVTEVDVVANTAAGSSATTWGTNAATSYGMTDSLASNGLWNFITDRAVYTTTNGTSYTTTALSLATGIGGNIQSFATLDLNRDGIADIVGTDTSAIAATDFQVWTSNGSGYNSTALAAPTTVVGDNLYWYGGSIAIDINGDGSADAIFGEADISSPLAVYINNGSGVLSTSYQLGAAAAGNSLYGLWSNGEVSAVDLTNNGFVDIAEHVVESNTSTNDYQVVLLQNNGGTTSNTSNWTVTQHIDNIFNNATNATANKYSMTWADFNNDGYMDLYLNAGRTTTGTTETSGRIYYNYGNGTLATVGTYVESNGASSAVDGLYSQAIDWNMDGAIDIVKVTTTGAVNLYTNSGNGLTWTTTTLATGVTNPVGVSAVDYDWDGDLDLLISRSDATATQLITNNNAIAVGSELHLRILDGNGIGAYFGNTVQLFDTNGNLVASQIINPQSGIGANDSSSLVNFYGLNPDTTYTVVMKSNANGVATSDTWSVATTDNTDATVLTTAHTVGATLNLVGTGYNDTLVANGLSGTINGSGGWSEVVTRTDTKTWSATGGMDTVDLSKATTALSVNLNTGSATGYGTLTLQNIEAAIGGSAGDTFTDSSVNNIFDGRGGNDTYNLVNGGHDTLVYTYMTATPDGGNGSDVANNFTLGSLATTANADIIDVRDLFKYYTGTAYVYKESDGTYHLDVASSSLNNYLKVTNDGTNTTIYADATGAGNFSTPLLTLNSVVTDLPTLLANNQLWVDSSTSQVAIVVNSQVTTDTTPLVTGSLPVSLSTGDALVVTINGVTYSSATGAVVVDPDNNTWYVQIPSTLATGNYDVSAVLRSANSSVISQDETTNELIISPSPTAPIIPASTDANNKATALTMNENGVWQVFANMTMLDQSATNTTNMTSFTSNTLTGNEGVMGTATFIDFNRDGRMDIVGEDSAYWDGQQAFENKGIGYTETLTATTAGGASVGAINAIYHAFQIGNASTSYAYNSRVDHSGSSTAIDSGTSANTYSWYGATAAYDQRGDGYVDIGFGDGTPNDEESQGGYDSSFVNNNSGTFQKDANLTWDQAIGWSGQNEYSQATPEKEVSSVDLNNDGSVDLVYDAWAGGNWISSVGQINYLTAYTTLPRLVVASNNGAGNLDITQIIENATVQWTDTSPYDGYSMTWADYNGDGYLDLFTSTGYGTVYDTVTSGISNGFNSRIIYNDGTGKLSATNTDADLVNEGMGTTYTFNDKSHGSGSVAVDWNADGKIDVIETPYYSGPNPGGTQNVLLFTNTTASGVNSFTQSTITSVADTGTGSAITGLLAFDMDWDGDKDLLLFTGTAGTTYKENTTTVNYGTALHLKIVDQNGINSLFGNTIKLYNSAGNLVSTQIINPQSGNQTSDSSALVDFYGLNANETYTAVLLRNVNGVSQDVGGVSSIGGFTIENVNAGWTGLTTANAYDSYVLTAESGTAVNNANIGNGIIGTGYNDTFFATLGTDIYQGGGGSTIISGVKTWSNTGGLDIVDYKLAGSTAITVDLSNTGAQNTGFGTATFKNIEGIAGTSGNDAFTDNSGNNYFNGRGGNDTFNLNNGGHDTLMYKLLSSTDATGGNGSDVVNGFHVGTVEATPDTDIIDVRDLLIGYTADSDGAAHYINGVATMDAGETIANYLNVSVSGGVTTVSIDRDGTGGAYSYTTLLTLNNVDTTLEKLLANHQIIIG